ncbi:hypothetical protein O181_076350 [Austropuccinia psidii MF-1]|uniref:Uncharacterized protein n=1 Tax=Austropuccinia psidii MF-1 TaxID=1389203 RepID=A0A9Q3IEX6_9BASI|nr:hypothetical protein [Austropuccinia psidii MF-1]
MNSYLHMKSFLGQEKTIELLGGWSPLCCKDKVKKINNWLKSQSLLSIDQRKELEMTPALETEGRLASTSSKPAPEMSKDKPKGPQKKQRDPKNHKGMGKRKANWHRPYPQGCRIPKLEPSAMDSVFNMARTFMEFTAKEKERMNRKLTEITLNITDLKKNDKQSAEMHKSVIITLEILTNTCDRIESKYQAQIDEMKDLSILNINDQLKSLKDHVLEISEDTNEFATHLAKSNSERQKLKNEIIANVEQIHKNYEPHMPRNATPLTEEKHSVKGSFTPLLGENVISEKDIPKLEEWPTFFGEGEYNHIELIRTIDMLQEDFNMPDEIIVGKLHWKDKPLTWFFKQKDRLSALHPDMSDTMINMKILRKFGGELEHAIKRRCVEPCSTEDYIHEMEDIINRTRIGKTWTKIPTESKIISKVPREDKKPEKPVLKCHQCGSTLHSANTCTKKTKINEVQVIEDIQCTEGKEESDLDSAVSENTSVEDYNIENITAFFEVTEVHTHFP